MTLRHLFSRTAGWLGDYFDDFGNGDDALARMVAKMADLPQITPLGQYWSYNNAAFYLAGRVLEVVAGKPFETLAKELVLDPLGMNMSFFSRPTASPIVSPWAIKRCTKKPVRRKWRSPGGWPALAVLSGASSRRYEINSPTPASTWGMAAPRPASRSYLQRPLR